MSVSKKERTARYAVAMAIGWTVVVLLSLFWNIHTTRKQTLDKVRVEARSYYNLSLSFRHWAAEHGGIYVPVTDRTQPNPYLRVPERDVTTLGGERLTLMNPAWITREVFERLQAESPNPVIVHLSSLKYLNPVNRPDRWETDALRKFERGAAEESERITLDGQPYLRIIDPFLIERPCLRCHARQGYGVGDVRGGISVSVPLAPYLEAEDREKLALALTHFSLWLAGSGGILLFTRTVRRSQRQLLDSETKYRSLFDGSPQPLWVSDAGTDRILAVNRAALRKYGYSEEEFLTMRVTDLLLPEAAEGPGPNRPGIRRHRRKDGSVILVETASHAVELGGRRAEVVLANDVTEREGLEEQLRQAQKMEAVGLLAGGVAHDFNNVLTAIIGYGNLIQMKLPAGDPLAAYAENIKVTAQRAAQLTQSLLAFSRKTAIHQEPLDLNVLVQRVSKLLKRLVREDVQLRMALAGGPATVFADGVQLEQVLMNLVANARDAMPGGGTLTISSGTADVDADAAARLGADAPGRYAVLTVSDTGTGMDEETRERVFEPFFTTKETGKGTGLGLATVYGIIRQHRGFAAVDSSPGSGTSIRVYLPLIDAPRNPPAVPTAQNVAGGDETVLVAEDDDAIRKLISSVLTEFGYSVIEARDGEEALRIFREQGDRIALLLLDAIMPRMNGKAAYDQIRRSRSDVKALFISGYSADTISREGVLEKGLHFLAKPLSPTELLRKVRDVLDGKAV